MSSAEIYNIRRRRFIFLLLIAVISLVIPLQQWHEVRSHNQSVATNNNAINASHVRAIDALGELAVKARASPSGYARSNFSSSWGVEQGCDMRNRILQRDLRDIELDDDDCTVLSGTLEKDMFSGKRIEFERGPETSNDIHIEHIVAVSDAWQKGAQDLSEQERYDFYNDPLNLIAIDGPTNMEKGDKDAGGWMPRVAYRCRYVARQIAIKLRYDLWLDEGEHRAMYRKLQRCPNQVLPIQGGNQ